MVQSSSTTPDGAAKWRNRTYRRFQVADLWTTPPGPRWSRVVQPGPGWSSRSTLRAEPSCGETERRAQRGRQRDRTAASSTVRSGMWRRTQQVPGAARRIPGLVGSGPGWTTPHWSRVVQPGPAWARVVQAARRGRAQPIHPGAVRNRRARRFRVDWPSAGRRGLHAAWTQLCGPPPGSPIREYLKYSRIGDPGGGHWRGNERGIMQLFLLLGQFSLHRKLWA
eukprot:COSAG02_NODE_415_length_22762_cov_133.681816_1_plen_223_part_00